MKYKIRVTRYHPIWKMKLYTDVPAKQPFFSFLLWRITGRLKRIGKRTYIKLEE